MRKQVEEYAARLLRDRSVATGGCAFAVKDGGTVAEGDPELARLAREALVHLPDKVLLAARPSLPFAELLVRRSPRGRRRILPRDSESRLFLRDIPFLRAEERGKGEPARIAALLSDRGAGIVEGVGIVAAGAATIEQAYVRYSSAFHATFLKYLEDLLRQGFLVPGEKEALREFREAWPDPASGEEPAFRRGPLTEPAEILEELADVGRRTVERGLVDSVFGNVSCLAGGVIHISRTGASLADLEGNVVPVLLDAPPPAGHAASSDLPIHRGIYGASRARTILHGHPRFSVVMSLSCDEPSRPARGCREDRDKVRYLADTPIVSGEIDAGGLAKRISPLIAAHGKAIVHGHGVITAGELDFGEPFRAMVEVEHLSREEYFRRLRKK